MTDATSSGDPAASLRLLWREHLPSSSSPRRGPRRALDVDSIVEAAIALADDEGLAALTIRGLAERLGVKPMTLYTYIPGRAELLDLILDEAFAKMPRPSFTEEPWQVRVRAVADRNLDLYRRHPWATHLSMLRPPLGPGQMAKYEYELSAFSGSGLSDLETDDALTFLLGFVRGAARDIESGRQAALRGENDQQWWDKVSPLLSEMITAEQYPLAARIGTAAGAAHSSAHDPHHAYLFGLDQTMRALEMLAAD